MAWKASEPVALGITYLRTLMVNVFFVAQDEGRESPWVLVDAGLPGHANAIRRAAQERFGERPPSAIVLTHGHFDHRGSLQALLSTWRVPVYAHLLEFPYLTGQAAYPPSDPWPAAACWRGCRRSMRAGPSTSADRWNRAPADIRHDRSPRLPNRSPGPPGIRRESRWAPR